LARTGYIFILSNRLSPASHLRCFSQGWKGSVKSRHFVLALQDYFLEKYTAKDISHQILTKDFTINHALVQANKTADDCRALACISTRTLQPVLEAFDDDSTGFITVKEVNQLTASKPKDWR
jgi:hypothetical protein